MKLFTLISPVAGLGLFGALCMASATGLAFYTATAGVADASPLEIKVRYGDLDLSSAAGVERLKRRVIRAAKQVCGDYGSRELQLSASYQHCVIEASDRALKTVGVTSGDSQGISQ
jgi:UrcA family protein